MLINVYPYGMLMPNRKNNTGLYRYGYNGKENDNEIKGDGNSIDYGARMYDPRIGRWFAVDPMTKKMPSWSPYNYGYNNPIFFIDPDGMMPQGCCEELGRLWRSISTTFSNDIANTPAHIRNLKNFLGISVEKVKPVSKESPAQKPNIDLKGVPFISQFTLERPNVACCRASQKILNDFGLNNSGLKSNRIIVARNNADDTSLDILSTAQQGISYIDAQLEEGNPVMVGVNHTLSKEQSDGEAADHFVVIKGRNTDDDGNVTYNFYEVGTRHEEKGKSNKNVLKLNSDGSLTGTNYAGKRSFTVTDIRKNENKKK